MRNKNYIWGIPIPVKVVLAAFSCLAFTFAYEHRWSLALVACLFVISFCLLLAVTLEILFDSVEENNKTYILDEK